MSLYLLDSNFFIQAHRFHYPFDVFPSFWNKVRNLADDGKILCIDKVKDELYQNDDLLSQWCNDNLPQSFFRESAGVLADYSRVSNWAVGRSHHYHPRAITEFLSADEADAWLVSHAISDGYTVVTHEVSNPNQKNKIKIPEVCGCFNVPYINTIELLRNLGESI